MPEYEREAYDNAIVRNAEYYTAVRFLGKGQYERHTRPTIDEIKELAHQLSNEVKKPYMVYAVFGRKDVLLGVVRPNLHSA